MTMVYLKKQYDYFAIKKSYTTSLCSLGLDIWTRYSKINKFKISNPMETSSWNRHRFDVEISTWIPFSKSTKYRRVLHMGFFNVVSTSN